MNQYVNLYKDEVQIAALAALCLGIAIVSKRPVIGFVMGALFASTANNIKKIF